MSIEELLSLLEYTPLVCEIHPISLCYLPSSVTVLHSMPAAVWLLDDPQPTIPGQILITASDTLYSGRFPYTRCDHDPFTPDLNGVLFNNYDEIASRMLCQSQVADHIFADAQKQDVVILFLVDGLSYQDVHAWADSASETVSVEPCLVDVPTLTNVAFPNVINDPPLPMRLFHAGYPYRLGFSYWTREDNKLTDRLFRTITEVHKTAYFPQILELLQDHLHRNRKYKSYIQIMRTGLDGYAHSQKRQPPIPAIVEAVQEEFWQLIELCRGLGLRACLYLTSDHGILWRHEFDPDIVGNAPGQSSPRWCTWQELYHQREKGRRFIVDREEYYCLGFPMLRRPLHIDEQGIHGGISFQESIVPFVTVRIAE